MFSQGEKEYKGKVVNVYTKSVCIELVNGYDHGELGIENNRMIVGHSRYTINARTLHPIKPVIYKAGFQNSIILVPIPVES